ncbi:16970_t:CDS:2 [Funneliformis caledonium]|uniref:16970_t:CDS:1 n=1 Tax=Funneliformis caledonium TaxID=1117310 RepID=A0A9N9IKG6_9GLOM|nr:16970_t:CDS:2 [Funneliformis caledonium]
MPKDKNTPKIKRTRAFLTKYDVSEEMICDILKEKKKWLELKSESYEALLKRQVKVEKAIENNITINGELLAQKAHDFVILLNEPDFKESEGWVVGFKKHHKLKCYLKYEESANASLEALDDMRKNLQSILADYLLDNIFNTDETRLYWKIKPNHTLKKQSKECVTIILCYNASETEKLKAVLLEKAKIHVL